MLTMQRAIALTINEERSSLEATAIIAAIFVTRCVIGSEKRDAVRNEIKSVIETLSDGETKVPKSTLNANVALGLKLAFHLSASKGVIRKDKQFLITVAKECDASTDDETKPDNVTSLLAELATHKVTVKLKVGDVEMPVTTRFRLSRLLGKPSKPAVLFKTLNAAITNKGTTLSLAEIASLQAALKNVADVVARRDLAAIAA